MLSYKVYLKTIALAVFSVIAIAVSIPVQADGAGAFIGGLAVARIGQNVRDQRDYEEDQAYYAQQQAQSAQQQADNSTPQTAEQKIAQLDKLAAGGYISKEEYKSRKQAILDSM